jgi:hypothetical protein
MPLSQGNIGHCDVAFFNAISNLNRFEEGTENPRVGSIPPLATISSELTPKEPFTTHGSREVERAVQMLSSPIATGCCCRANGRKPRREESLPTVPGDGRQNSSASELNLLQFPALGFAS